jgi:hypothetical protein
MPTWEWKPPPGVKWWLRDISGPHPGESAHDYARRTILHWAQQDEEVRPETRGATKLTQKEADLIGDGLTKGDLSFELQEKIRRLVHQNAKSKTGLDESTLASRDAMICWTIANLVKHYRLAATRKPSTKRPSAASIVWDVLGKLMKENISERTVNNIWARHKNQYRGYFEVHAIRR